MRDRFNTFKNLHNKGFTMITVTMILLVLSILGISIMTFTMSNFNFTTIDRDNESVYYIAESGINKVLYEIEKKVNELSNENLTHDKFFEEL